LFGRQDVLQVPCFCEGLKASVVGTLNFLWKTAAGQLARCQMVAYAFAAHTFCAAAGICTFAAFKVLAFFAFHIFEDLS